MTRVLELSKYTIRLLGMLGIVKKECLTLNIFMVRNGLKKSPPERLLAGSENAKGKGLVPTTIHAVQCMERGIRQIEMSCQERTS